MLERATEDEIEDALAPSATRLLLERPRIENLTALRPIAPLRELTLVRATRLTSLRGIEAVAKTLKVLYLHHCPRLADLSDLTAATELEDFAFDTLLSVTSNQKVGSLTPLAELRNLRSIRMSAVVAADGDLSPLFHLDKLDDVKLPNFYSVEQMGRLAGAVPPAAAASLAPTKEFTRILGPCPVCGDDRQVMLIGARRNRFVCPTCDAPRIEHHIAEYERYRHLETRAS